MHTHSPQVISCPPLFRRPWARQPTSTSFSTAWAYDVNEKLLLTNSHCVTDGVVINVRMFVLFGGHWRLGWTTMYQHTHITMPHPDRAN